jgi:hypothetical protein
MHATDRFLRFAAECEVMAKFTRNREDKAVWNGLAQRWLRCAELIEREQANVHHASPGRRQRTFLQNMSH